MKRIFLILLMASTAFGATKNLVPRTAGEGAIGTPLKPWGRATIDSLFLTKLQVDLTPDSVLTVVAGQIKMAGYSAGLPKDSVLSKTRADTAAGPITFLTAITCGAFRADSATGRDSGIVAVRRTAIADTVQVKNLLSINADSGVITATAGYMRIKAKGDWTLQGGVDGGQLSMYSGDGGSSINLNANMSGTGSNVIEAIKSFRTWAGGDVTADTLKANKGLSVGGGTMIKKIITGTQTFTALNTVDTTVVSGAVAASRVQITFKGSTVLTACPVARTTVDSLFVTCAIADTAKAREFGYDYQLTNE